VDDVPFIFLVRLPYTNLVSERVQGVSLFDFGYLDVASLWLKE
jgi:hypothetical protein